MARAHRLSWEWVNGPVPKGLKILHRCDNPSCVRPSHLYAGTSQRNSNDMMERNRHPNKKKTHCPQGHAYRGANIIHFKNPNGKPGRKCRTCHNERRRRP